MTECYISDPVAYHLDARAGFSETRLSQGIAVLVIFVLGIVTAGMTGLGFAPRTLP